MALNDTFQHTVGICTRIKPTGNKDLLKPRVMIWASVLPDLEKIKIVSHKLSKPKGMATKTTKIMEISTVSLFPTGQYQPKTKRLTNTNAMFWWISYLWVITPTSLTFLLCADRRRRTELRRAAWRGFVVSLLILSNSDREEWAEVGPNWFWGAVWLLLDGIKRFLWAKGWRAPHCIFVLVLWSHETLSFQHLAKTPVSFSRRFWPVMSHQNFRVWKGSPLTKTFPSMLG